MAFEITSDTVVKVLVRRGLESERTNTLLSEGELGYSVDLKRLFIGDGYTLGGNTIGIKNFGNVTNKSSYLNYMQEGDLIRENNILYFLNSNNTFNSVMPALFSDPLEPTFGTIEYSPAPDNGLRLSYNGLGDGFIIDYSVGSNSSVGNTIQKDYSKLNFDARYISLCASANSWYIGNVFSKTVKNNLSATLNVADEIFVNDSNSNPYQLQLYAKDPAGTANTLIKGISGGTILMGRSSVGLVNGFTTATSPQFLISNSGALTFAPSIAGQSRTNPGNLFYGVTRFLSSVYMDENLFVGGTVFASTLSSAITYTTTTTALSVVSDTTIAETCFIANTNALNNQNILRVAGNAGSGVLPYIIAKDNENGGGVVAINHDPLRNGNYTLAISGSVGISTAGAAGTSNKVDINTTTLNLKGTTTNVGNGGTVLIYGGANTTTIQSNVGGVTDYVDVQGNLRVTRDITAFYTSDERLKDNKIKITNALDKIDKLSGISFNWNEKSGKTGKDYGVIAQEVEKVLPEVVTTREDGYKAVNYDRLIPLLIEAIKELKDR